MNAAGASGAIFCEPGPSRPRNNGVNNQQQPSGSSSAGSSSTTGNGRNNGLDYEIEDLVNFPDPAAGDYDPTNSLSSSFPPMDSHPVDLEDIQVQNFVPEHFHHKNVEASASVSSASSQQQQPPPHIIPHQSMGKYINNNDMKDDLASSGSLGNISLAFSGLPGKSSTSNSDSVEAKASSSSSNSYHSSILESMTGPLSKRLRTLHSLQQQQSSSSSASTSDQAGSSSNSFKVNGKGKKSSNNEVDTSETSSKSSKSTASTSSGSNNTASTARQRFDPEQDDDGSAASGSSNTIQTFCVKIETIGEYL